MMKRIALAASLIGSAASSHAIDCSSLSDLNSGCEFQSDTLYAGGVTTTNARSILPAAGFTPYNKIVYYVDGYNALALDNEVRTLDSINSLATAFSPMNVPLNMGNVRRLMSEYLQAGYTIVTLTYSDQHTYLQQKGLSVAEAIKSIANWQTSSEKSTLIGYSLGGVAARYALTTLESESIEHNVENYISIDSPHKGANIPLSLQFMIQFMYSALDKWEKDATSDFGHLVSSVSSSFNMFAVAALTGSPEALVKAISESDGNELFRELIKSEDEASQYLKYLNTVAVRQLLINHFQGSPSHALHGELMSELNALGMPKQTRRNISVSNASRDGADLHTPGTTLMTFDSGKYKDSNWWFTASTTDADTSFSGHLRYPESSLEIKTKTGWHCAKKVWGECVLGWPTYDIKIDINKKDYRKTYATPSNALNLDNANCSTTNIVRQVSQELGAGGFAQYSNDPVAVVDHACFIPGFSSLNIDTSNINNQIVSISSSGFDLALINTTHNDHGNIPNDVRDVLIDLIDTPNADIQSNYINTISNSNLALVNSDDLNGNGLADYLERNHGLHEPWYIPTLITIVNSIILN